MRPSVNCRSVFKTNNQWRMQDFPEGGAPTPKSTIILQIFCRKLHENEKIWTPGRHVPGPLPPPPPHQIRQLQQYCFINKLAQKSPAEKMVNSIQLIFHPEKLRKVEQNESNITF